MFETLQEAFDWAKKAHPGCSFSVRAQADGPTIVSIKGKGDTIRQVVYVRQAKKDGVNK